MSVDAYKGTRRCDKCGSFCVLSEHVSMVDELKAIAEQLAAALSALARKDDQFYPVAPYIQDGVDALAAYRAWDAKR